jgi:hypothetical protein
MRSPAPLSFGRSIQQVEDMMEHGTAFARVEDAIDSAALSEDHKAALWLFAWSHREPTGQRRDARLALAGVGPGSFAGG